MKVLITGMSGLIGGVLRERLESRHELTALNRRAVEGVRCLQADITDFDAIRPAFEGVDAVIHLSAQLSSGATWESCTATNVTGSYNVFEAARQAGVKRVVFTSSGATVAGWEKDEPYRSLVQDDHAAAPPSWPMIDHRSEIRPNGLYAWSKASGEALARYFVDAFGMSILCVRLGHVTREDRPMSARDFSVWCSKRDAAELFERCLMATAEHRFDIFYAQSDNKWGYRDLSHAREVLGFTPQDSAEDHR